MEHTIEWEITRDDHTDESVRLLIDDGLDELEMGALQLFETAEQVHIVQVYVERSDGFYPLSPAGDDGTVYDLGLSLTAEQERAVDLALLGGSAMVELLTPFGTDTTEVWSIQTYAFSHVTSDGKRCFSLTSVTENREIIEEPVEADTDIDVGSDITVIDDDGDDGWGVVMSEMTLDTSGPAVLNEESMDREYEDLSAGAVQVRVSPGPARIESPDFISAPAPAPARQTSDHEPPIIITTAAERQAEHTPLDMVESIAEVETLPVPHAALDDDMPRLFDAPSVSLPTESLNIVADAPLPSIQPTMLVPDMLVSFHESLLTEQSVQPVEAAIVYEPQASLPPVIETTVLPVFTVDEDSYELIVEAEVSPLPYHDIESVSEDDARKPALGATSKGVPVTSPVQPEVTAPPAEHVTPQDRNVMYEPFREYRIGDDHPEETTYLVQPRVPLERETTRHGLVVERQFQVSSWEKENVVHSPYLQPSFNLLPASDDDIVIPFEVLAADRRRIDRHVRSRKI